MSPIMLFVFGVLVGFFVGMFTMALVVAVSNADAILESGRRNRLGVRKCQ